MSAAAKQDSAVPDGATHREHGHRSLHYRPALDGLRAVAVVAVFLFHARPGWLPGGWLGVDVFFVLSGFLITTLLLTEHHTWGWISFAGFWKARARRLLPAVVLLLIAVLFASRWWMPSGRLGAVAGDALATALYVANWRFLLGDEAYFAAIAAPSPLRHAWSLAVEEQFYLVFPLLLAALLAMAGRRRLGWVFAGLAAASALWMAHLHVPGADPSRVYYGTDTRAFELLMGAAVAAVLSPGATGNRELRLFIDRWARRLSLPLLIGVFAAFALVRSSSPRVFEGGLVLFALAVIMIVVAAMSPNPSIVARGLGNPVLRYVGAISYGVYLWHWPILVFMNQARFSVPGPILLLMHVGSTFAAAAASYHFVEQPIRRQGFMALIPGYPLMSRTIIATSILGLTAGGVLLGRADVSESSAGEVWAEVQYAPASAVSSVHLIGNSIPYSLYEGLRAGTNPATDLQLSLNASFGCDTFEYPRIANSEVVVPHADCAEWRRSWTDQVVGASPDLTVVFLSHGMLSDFQFDGHRVLFGSAEHENLLTTAWDDVVRRIRAAGSDRVAFVNLSCHRVPDFGGLDDVTRANNDELVIALNATLDRWASTQGISVFDQHAFLCADGYQERIRGIELYSDYWHFTPESASLLWSWLAPQVQLEVARSVSS